MCREFYNFYRWLYFDKLIKLERLFIIHTYVNGVSMAGRCLQHDDCWWFFANCLLLIANCSSWLLRQGDAFSMTFIGVFFANCLLLIANCSSWLLSQGDACSMTIV